MKLLEEEQKIKRIDDEIEILRDTQSVQSRRITELTRQRGELQKELLKKKPSIIAVTDHAMIRYIERVYTLDVEKLKTEIAGSLVNENTIELGGNGKYNYNGVTFILKDYKIITVY